MNIAEPFVDSTKTDITQYIHTSVVAMLKDAWDVPEKDCRFQLTKANYRVDIGEKFKLLPGAQQRLIRAIQTQKDLVQPPVTDYFSTSNWMVDKDVDFVLHVGNCEPDTFVVPKLSQKIWKPGLSQYKVTRLKQLALRESIKLSDKARVWMISCIKLYKETPVEEIPKPVKNCLVVDVMDPIVDNFERRLSEEVWMNSDQSLDALDESDVGEDVIVGKPGLEEFFPKSFCTDLYVQVPLLPEPFQQIPESSRMKRQWKVRKQPVWNTNPAIAKELVNESISKFEVKYKLFVSPITMNSTPLEYKDMTQWKISKYQTYMMNWKMFENWKLRDVLEEEVDLKVNISVSSDSICRYIKLKDINSTIKPITPTKTLSIQLNYESPSQNSNVELSEIKEAATIMMNHTSSPPPEIETKSYSSENCTPDSPSTIAHQTPVAVEITIVSPTTTATSTSAKHQLDEIDTLILQKRQKMQKRVQLDNKRYPYLDVFNQTTTVLDVSERLLGSDNVSESKEIVHMPLPRTHADILDVSEELIDVSLFDGVPDEMKIWLFVNVAFAKRFGAGFMQLTKMVGDRENVELLDFVGGKDGRLEFDMFLNAQCGVIFLRTIDVYQRNLKTGESIVLGQIAEIAYCVTSLIVVVAVEAGADPDKKVLEFVDVASEYGIQVCVIDNDGKSVATAMVELVLRYGEMSEIEFSWTNGHQFLEACGIVNPLLQTWILNQCKIEEFVAMSGTDRERLLGELCSAELLEIVNRGVREFNEI